MSSWLKIIGTQTGKFILGLTGVQIKNNAGELDVRNNSDTAFAPLKASTVTVFNDTATHGNTLQTDPTQAVDVTYTLPLTAGTASQVMSTDGTGILSWVSAGSNAQCLSVDTTSIAFGSSSTVAAFTLPANAVIDSVITIVDTAFDGTANLSVGTSGAASKYFASTDALLSVGDRYQVPNQIAADVASEALIISYSAGGATVGAARVLVSYSIPS